MRIVSSGQITDARGGQIRPLILISGIVTTLIVWIPLYDPVNMPKMVLLALLSAWVMGSVLTTLISFGAKGLSLGHWSLIVFMAGILLAGLLTDVKYTAFYGAIYRNNGAFSYLAMAGLSLGSMIYFRSSDLRSVRVAFFLVGLVMTGYGFVQIAGHDPFHWIVTYTPVMGTLGNPDFMSALLGVCSIAMMWVIAVTPKNWVRLSASVLMLAEIYVTKKTGSFQGLLIIAMGLAIVGVAKAWQWKKLAGYGAVGIAFIGAIPVVMGFANVGPLASRVYRGSLLNRFDYWHAAINMFKAHPFAGVGLDRFRDYYTQYAVQHQVVQGQMTDNAHNVFMQLLATGGLMVIVPYVFLLGVILWTAARAILRSNGILQLNLVGLFGIWFSLLLDSFIAIDNLGVTVWFWITGGILYGVSREALNSAGGISSGKGTEQSGKAQQGKSSGLGRSGKPGKSGSQGKSAIKIGNSESSLLSPVVSLVLVVATFVAMVPAWNQSRDLQSFKMNSSTFDRTGYLKKLGEYGAQHSSNVHLVTMLSDLAFSLGYPPLNPPLALTLSKEVLTKDPRSYTGNYISAQASEAIKDFIGAIPYRVHLLTLDPWNTANMLTLVKDYVAVNDLIQAKEMSAKISALNPSSEDAKTAAGLVHG